jgi:hypothetical protein
MVKNTYELLKDLEKDGKLKDLTKSGIVSPIYNNYIEIFEYYKRQLRKSEKMNAIYLTAEHFNISDSSVYKIIGKMKF